MRGRMVWFVMLISLLVAGCLPQANHIQRVTPLPDEVLLYATATPQPTEEPFYAWDFNLPTLEGETIALSSLRGEWVIINFWATWCAPCRHEMPVLQAIHTGYDDVTVLGINQSENRETVQPFIEAMGITFPILMQPDFQTLQNYSVVGLPQTLIVNPQGEVVFRQFGPVTLDLLTPFLPA